MGLGRMANNTPDIQGQRETAKHERGIIIIIIIIMRGNKNHKKRNRVRDN
jgi:hypothetical protein